MKLILARHGNTFEPGQPVTWVGLRSDVPLAKEGIAQALRLADYLKGNSVRLAAIYTGALQRTRVYAHLIAEELKIEQLEPIVDSRLNEIDYGGWTGLTQDQIIQKFGDRELQAWEKNSRWPKLAGWTQTESQVIDEVQSFFMELTRTYGEDDTVLVVSSNGRLRYFLSLVPDEFRSRVSSGSFKVKTGNFCALDYRDGKYSVDGWNLST